MTLNQDSTAYPFWSSLLSLQKPFTDLHAVNRHFLSPTSQLPLEERNVIISELESLQTRLLQHGDDGVVVVSGPTDNIKSITEIALEFALLYLRTNEFKNSPHESQLAKMQFTSMLNSLERIGMHHSKLAALIHNNRALLFADEENYVSAINDYSQAITIEPNYAMCYFNRAVTSAALMDKRPGPLSSASSSSSSSSTSLSSSSSTVNTCHLPSGYAVNRDSVMRDYSEAIRIDPTYPFPYNNRGVLYYERKQFSMAVDDCVMAFTVSPDYCNAHFNLSLCYSVSGRWIHALRHVAIAHRITPSKSNYMLQVRALRLYLTNRSRDALTDSL